MECSIMSTSQQTRIYSPVDEDQLTNTWSSVFIDECSTMNHSTTFVKQLLAVALSCITYLRSFFTEAAYGNKVIDGLNLKLLLSDCRCIGPNTFVQNIVACFDAIEKQYLKEMKFIVYEHDPDYPLEIYRFRFTYDKDGCAYISELKGHSGQSGGSFSIKSLTMKMLRSIILLIQSFDQLPDTVFFGFKLFYYDEVTPSGYEPLGFMPVIHHEAKFPSDLARIKAGNVRTMFHGVQLSVHTVCSRNLVDNVHDPHTQTELQVSKSNSYHSSSDFIEEQENPPAHSPEPVLHRSVCASGMKKMLKKQTLLVKPYGKSMPNTDKTATEERKWIATFCPRKKSLHSGPTFNNQRSKSPIRCPCGVFIEDGPMVTCTICSFRQHAVCFKLLEEKDMQLKHVCEICADLAHSCTDYSLTSTDLIQVRETCLFRRLLVHLRNDENYHTPASLAQLLHVSTNMGKRLMVRLQSEGALASEPSNDPRGRLVDQKMLFQFVIPHVFHKDQLPDYQMYTSSLQIIRELVREEDQKDDVQLNAVLIDIQENGVLKCDKQANRTDEKDAHNNAHQNHIKHISKQNDIPHDAEIGQPMILRPRQNYEYYLCQGLKIQKIQSKKLYASSLQMPKELISKEDRKSDEQLTASLPDIQENCDLKADNLGRVVSRRDEEDPHIIAFENHSAFFFKQNYELHGAEISHPMILRPRQNHISHSCQTLEITNIQRKMITREHGSEEDQKSDVHLIDTLTDVQENVNLKCCRLRSVANRRDEDPHNNVHQNHPPQTDALHSVKNNFPMILRPRHNCKLLSGQTLKIQNIHSKRMN
ncbi:uncharacterized protein [Panulirus ornatus]|uniref:uncharacterized protein isoform X2 n=1 Tax=Panulirus ornatus TaxID=150431 RepID=UPI003A85B7DD